MNEQGELKTNRIVPFNAWIHHSIQPYDSLFNRLKAEADAAKAEADKKKAEKKAKKKKAKEAKEGEEEKSSDEGESAPPTEAPPAGNVLLFDDGFYCLDFFLFFELVRGAVNKTPCGVDRIR